MSSTSGSMYSPAPSSAAHGKRDRIQLIDALRGLSIILMLAYHFGFALYMFGLLSEKVLFHPLLGVLQPVFAGLFILLCGVSSRFSRSNLRRGLLTLACGCAVTAVTWFAGMPIWFGILQFLGVCMVLYSLIGRAIERMPRWPALFLWLALFVACYIIFPIDSVTHNGLAWLGVSTPEFRSGTADYFPLARWFFLFLFGTVTGGFIKDGCFPKWFYTLRIPFLPFAGRHTMVLYMVHQPLYFGILTLYTYLINR